MSGGDGTAEDISDFGWSDSPRPRTVDYEIDMESCEGVHVFFLGKRDNATRRRG